MVATLMVHPRITKIHKNFLGDTPNNFKKFRDDWMCGFWIHWVQTNKQTNKLPDIHFYIHIWIHNYIIIIYIYYLVLYRVFELIRGVFSKFEALFWYFIQSIGRRLLQPLTIFLAA